MPVLNIESSTITIHELAEEEAKNVVSINGKHVEVEILKDSPEDQSLLVSIAGKVLSIKIGESSDRIWFPVELNGKKLSVSLQREETMAPHREAPAEEKGPIVISAPMAGKIVSVKVSVGAKVSEGEALAVLEAMKMENEIAAPKNGTVGEVYAKPGSLVKAGDKLVLIN